MATIPMSGECRKTVRTEKLHRTEVQNSEQGAPSKSQRERRGLGNEMVLTGQYREEMGGACSGGAKRR